MRIGVIGINHKCAELSFREKLAKATQRPFGGSVFHPEISYVLLSTCNRTEVYFCAPDLAACHTYCMSLLRESIEEEFEHRIYAYFGSDCFEHLARVTAGLDSAAYGETEIQGQVKCAYEQAAKSRYLSSEIHYLFQKSLKMGKELRSNRPKRRDLPSLENAIFDVVNELHGSFENKSFLFVGASEINLRIASRFKSKAEITFCNRSEQKLERFAAKENLSRLPWDQLDKWHTFDVIIVGTKAADYLILERGTPPLHSPKVLIDLSVPRNIDPELSKKEYSYLFNIDELQQRFSSKGSEIRDELPTLKQSVFKSIARFHAKRSKPLPLFSTLVYNN